MDETILTQEADTAPQDPAESGVAGADPATVEPADHSEAEGTTPAEEPAQDSGEPQASPTIPIKFNHEDREVSIAEATELAQKGVKLDYIVERMPGKSLDELNGVMETLQYLASVNGQSIPDLAKTLMESSDQQLRESLKDKCYNDAGLLETLFSVEKEKRQKKYTSDMTALNEQVKQQQTTLEQRLAEEFTELHSEFPEIENFKSIPKTVLETATTKKITLTDAYLRWQRAESRKAEAAKAVQQQAAKASLGSQAAGAGETIDPTIEAMLKGVWG